MVAESFEDGSRCPDDNDGCDVPEELLIGGGFQHGSIVDARRTHPLPRGGTDFMTHRLFEPLRLLQLSQRRQHFFAVARRTNLNEHLGDLSLRVDDEGIAR